MLRVNIDYADGRVVERETLTAGMVGLKMKLRFSPAWRGLHKDLVFWAGDERRTGKITDGETETSVEVPHEVLATAGEVLFLGVKGYDETGGLVIPTVQILLGPVEESADMSGAEGTEPTPTELEQLQMQIGLLGNLKTEEKSSAVAAINELYESGGGGSGGAGADGEDGATFTPLISEDGTLSWTNDKGLENPAPVNIMGPAGADG